MVRDLGSLNGTFYKDVRIGRGIAIPYGEVFSIGTLHFVLEKIEGDTAKMAIGGDEQDESDGEIKNVIPSPDVATDKIVTPITPVPAAAAGAKKDELTFLEDDSPFIEIVSEPIEPIDPIKDAEPRPATAEQKPESSSSDDDLNFDDILTDLLG